MKADAANHPSMNRSAKGRARQRCIGCGHVFPTAHVMASTIGLCSECSIRSPYGWRTVYDRERQIGQIPANLAPAR
jgi:hypothetical protein